MGGPQVNRTLHESRAAGDATVLPQYRIKVILVNADSRKGKGTYHYTQKDYRTELYYFRIIFGNSCSVITEPICFWN